MEKLIKSKERVNKFGEVFTPKHIVKEMCDLVSEECGKIDSTFLEPACGTGNFLVEILERKLKNCKTPDDGLTALASLFGIDIQGDNVVECRERLLKQFVAKFPYIGSAVVGAAMLILTHNIVKNDFLALSEHDIDIWASGGVLPPMKGGEIDA